MVDLASPDSQVLTQNEIGDSPPPKTQEPDFSKYSPDWLRYGTGTYYSDRDLARFRYAVSKIEPQILEGLEKGDLFGRWSPNIDEDMQPGKTSSALFGNWHQKSEPLKETGISVQHLSKRVPNFGLDLRYSMAGVAGHRPRELFILRGKPVDIGLDSEILLDPSSIQVVLKVPYESKVVEENPDITTYNQYGPEAEALARNKK